jgi:dihydrofolate synthase/folylpolyglutamate synthase
MRVRFAEAVRDLDGRQPESMPGPSLDRIRAVAELLDHPELTYPSIQVTGTNGKTTTALAVGALVCAHGLRAGVFTSPHVRSLTERVAVCDESMTEEEFGEEYERLLPYLQRVDAAVGPVTYFETLTALAFLWFADTPVAVGVFEVGMGGTWDATNLVAGDVAVLCPVGLDHVGILGSTVAEIAGEKAGIIKEGRVAVIREQTPEAFDVIERRAKEVGAQLLLEHREWGLSRRTQAVGGQLLTVTGIHAEYDHSFLPLFGEEMARNAAASIVAVESLLGRALDARAVRAALSGLSTPGRLEVAGHQPLVLLDGAHNPDAAAALARTLTEFTWERLHLVVGTFSDKDVEAVLRPLVPLAAQVYATRSSSPRAAPVDRVAAAARAAGAVAVEEYPTVDGAVAAARAAAADDDLILVTGSFYTVADAHPLFVRS